MRIVVENAVARFPEFRFREPCNWTMEDGENWAVIGPNGGGKTLFANIIQQGLVLREGSVRYFDADGNEVCGSIASLVFRDIHSLSVQKNMYYQQRWNSADVEESPVAAALLEGWPEDKIEEYASLFGILSLLGRRIISLSSGELRKFLIMRALMSEPSILIIDNPFIGLDVSSRRSLDGMLSTLHSKKGLQTILVLSQTKDLPQRVDKVLPVDNMTVGKPVARKDVSVIFHTSESYIVDIPLPLFPETVAESKTEAVAGPES